MFRINPHQSALYCASLPDKPFSVKSCMMLSLHLHIGLLFTLLVRITNPLSCILLDISPTFVVSLILSFLILSCLVTPLINLNIPISVTANLFSSAFFAAHGSARTSLLVLFPLTLKIQAIKEGLYRILCGVNRLGDSGVNTLGDSSAFVNPAGQLLLTRQGKTRMYGVGIVFY